MFFPDGHVRVWLYGEPVDMRKSYDGLCALARHGLKQDPLHGALFAFVNRRGTQIKVLYFAAAVGACGPSGWRLDDSLAAGTVWCTARWTAQG